MEMVRGTRPDLTVRVVRPGFIFEVGSQTDGEKTYRVLRGRAGQMACPCDGDVYRGPGVCTHCVRVEIFLAEHGAEDWVDYSDLAPAVRPDERRAA